MEEADRLHIDSDPVDDPHELSENNAGNVPQNQNNNVHTNNNNDNNNATTNAKESYASVVPFSALVELCERSSKTTKQAQKKMLLQKFFSHYHDDDYFPVMRLLLPQLDKERQTYGMKETVLGKLYVEILGIAPNSEDAQRLIHWRKPTGNADDKMSGDFGNAVYLSLKNRCVSKGDLTLADLNSCLDELNVVTDRKDRVKVLKKMLRRTTALEQKWLVRIILKELKMGLSEKSVLQYFHPDALELFNVSSNLRTVCQELKNPNIRITSVINESIGLFHPIKPMLASRHSPEDVVKIMEGNPFVIEQKFDGERMQVHKNGKEVRLFSRNSNDVTDIYGDKLIPIIQHHVLVSRCILDGELLVWDAIAGRFEEFGNLKTFAKYNQHGDNSTSQDDQRNAHGLNIGKQLCYIIFDLLYVNDRSVMDLSLQQRMLLLKRCVKPKTKMIEIVEQREAKSTADVIEALDNAITNREEGIIIKNLNSTYVPSERKSKWVKLKPEYIEGLGDDLDLLIVGGYYGTGVGRRGGTISHFMLGVPVKEDENDTEPKTFYSFCKVGSGYSDGELKVLQEMLQGHWHVYKTSNPPAWLQLQEPFKEKPDVYINPSDSKILQVKAAQLVPSEKYKAGYTLRFPRVMKIRVDKNWNECLDLKGLNELAMHFGGRYARRKYGDMDFKDGEDVDALGQKKKKRKSTAAAAVAVQRRARTVVSHYMDTDTSALPVHSTLFDGMEFCVMNGDEQHSKSELEVLIHQHAGRKVQYPLVTTHCVIAARKVLKVQNLIERGEYDIIHYQWILDCIAQQMLLPLEPRYMIYTKPETQDLFLLEIDKFGDSYTNDATIKSLKEAFEQVDRERTKGSNSSGSIYNLKVEKKEPKQEPEEEGPGSEDQTQHPLSQAHAHTTTPATTAITATATTTTTYDETTVAKVEGKYFQQSKPWWGMFRNYCVYLDRYLEVGNESLPIPNSRLEISEKMLIFYGATICPAITPAVTHIVMDPKDMTRYAEIRKQVKKCLSQPPHLAKHIVSSVWVDESVNFHEDLDEGEFYISSKHLQQHQQQQQSQQRRH